MSFIELAQVKYLGQGRVLRELSILADVIQNGENVNILLQGPSGHGKTELAHLFLEYLDRENNNSFKYLPNRKGEITLRQEARFHFLDEVHELKTPESLYPFMDSGEFTFILATNEYDKLKEPVLNRCIILGLQRYTNDVLAWIIYQVFKKKKFNIEYEWCKELTHYCRENPRVAIATARRLAFAFQQLSIPNTIEELHIFMFRMFGTTQSGLTPNDLLYLNSLRNCNGLASLKTLKGLTNLPLKMIEESIEPYLISKRLIQMTTKGRKLI